MLWCGRESVFVCASLPRCVVIFFLSAFQFSIFFILFPFSKSDTYFSFSSLERAQLSNTVQ